MNLDAKYIDLSGLHPQYPVLFVYIQHADGVWTCASTDEPFPGIGDTPLAALADFLSALMESA